MSEQAGLPEPGEVVAGKYRVRRALGSGGMGAVFEAVHTVSGQAVALKWLRPKLAADPQATRRFIREARAAARIRHPNVVDIYGVEEDQGRVFLVFELLEGETLRERLTRGPLELAECLALALPAMRGVSAAHAQGVVHRDLKPENVFLTRDPDERARVVPKVLDFGISKLAADSPEAEGTLTATGAMLGTPHYMSLEQLQGAEVDARADVYAFGVMLYECLTGVRPFDSDNFSAIVVKAATEVPRDPRALRPELPRALADVVLHAMARTREQRPGSMQALIEALQPFASPAQASGTQAAPAERAKIAPRSRARWALAALALLLAGSGAAFWLDAQPRRTQAATPAARGNTATAAAPAAATPAAGTPTATTTSTSAATAAPGAPTAGSPAPAPSPGADTPSAARPSRPTRFASGWVYLGDYDDGTWITRYFDGWSGGLPATGTIIRARGHSHVRLAMPDDGGDLAGVNTTLGPGQRVRVLQVASWQGGSYAWAQVAPAW